MIRKKPRHESSALPDTPAVRKAALTLTKRDVGKNEAISAAELIMAAARKEPGWRQRHLGQVASSAADLAKEAGEEGRSAGDYSLFVALHRLIELYPLIMLPPLHGIPDGPGSEHDGIEM